ncbi:MAG: putative membrane protein [Candidatus Paceibacteria bacterium]|jgi:uncharacterized membrane protein
MQKLYIIIIILLAPFISFAQVDDASFASEYFSGKVIETQTSESGHILYRTQLSDGTTIELDTFGEEIPVGARVYVEYFTQQDYYNFVTVNRVNPMIFLTILFVLSIIILARKKGLRSLGSLGLSILLLFGVLIPLLLRGFDPLWTTLIFGLVILFISIFVTHGFNKQSLVAFLGSFGSIILAFVLLSIVTEATFLTGLINDHIQYLSFEVENTINLVRLVSASIIIGVLGVLDDITVTQVAVVRELSSTEGIKKNTIFAKALRVGRDHISSLVNTLVFAYVGATLPLIMFISLLEIPFLILISQEFIFIEIIRSLIGAIALTLAVPLTTWLAAYVFLPAIKRDQKALESACAHHNH